MEQIKEFWAVIVAVIVSAFGYGHLHGRVQTLEREAKENREVLTTIASGVADIRERLGRIEGIKK